MTDKSFWPPRFRRRGLRSAWLVAGAATTALAVACGGVQATDSTGSAAAHPEAGSGDALELPPLPTTATTEPAAAMPSWEMLPVAPIRERTNHRAVWTGSEMVAWGGAFVDNQDKLRYLDDGAAYNPTTRTWRVLAPAPLQARSDHFAFWTGQEMLVWGGVGRFDGKFRDGATYDPATDTWRKMADFPLRPRSEVGAAWAGGRLAVWGGRNVFRPNDPFFADGAAYDPASDTWTQMAPPPITGRVSHATTSLSDRVLFWGGSQLGEEGGTKTDGAIYDPATNTWTPITPAPHPNKCLSARPCLGTWTGTEAIFLNARLAYHVDRDSWREIPDHDAAKPGTAGQSALWSSQAVLGWGGMKIEGEPAEGGAYHPDTDTWSDIEDVPLSPRGGHSAIWTGEQMIIWGGTNFDGGGGPPTQAADGAAYRPPAR